MDGRDGEAFVRAVEATARAHGMWARGDGVVVAVSGGPDSLALLDVLCRLAPSWELRLHPVHVDHGLRPDSAEDARWVAERVAERGLRLLRVRVAAARFAARHRLSPEAAARLLRYRALEAVRRRVGAVRIAVGHHRDDVAETVLIRLLTGGGSDGLAGIPPVRGPIVRPLIERSRAEILAYLEGRGIAWREDPTNRNPRFLRNRIRHQLLPWLERHVNPRVREALCRTATLLRDEVAWLETQAQEALQEALLDPGDGALLALAVAPVAALPPALQRRVLRLACWQALRRRLGRAGRRGAVAAADEAEAAAGARLPLARVEDLRRLLAGTSRGVDLGGGLHVRRSGDRLLWIDRAAHVRMY